MVAVVAVVVENNEIKPILISHIRYSINVSSRIGLMTLMLMFHFNFFWVMLILIAMFEEFFVQVQAGGAKGKIVTKS